MKMMIRGWVKRKFVFPLLRAIKQGISIERLAISIALGITIGLIPLYGLTTIIVAAIAISLRLNFVAMQVAHYIVPSTSTPFVNSFSEARNLFVEIIRC